MAEKSTYKILVACSFVCLAFIKCYNPPDIAKTIDDIRKGTHPGFDSTMHALAAQNQFFDSIFFLIRTKKLKEATVIVDSLIAFDPKEDYYYVIKGEVYEANGRDDSALSEYDMAISKQTFPSWGLDRRAKIYIRRNKLDSALNDYVQLYEMNYDFSKKIAQVFELKKQKDSAVKYYKIYLEHYPDSLRVQQKILSLQK